MTAQRTHTLLKKERLRGEIRVANLFVKGKAFISYPFRVVYIEGSEKKDISAQLLFSVPKKRFKSAVKRNRLKRQMKEAYRLHKHLLLEFLENKNKSLQIAITYVSDDQLPYAEIEKKMIATLQKLQNEIG